MRSSSIRLVTFGGLLPISETSRPKRWPRPRPNGVGKNRLNRATALLQDSGLSKSEGRNPNPEGRRFSDFLRISGIRPSDFGDEATFGKRAQLWHRSLFWSTFLNRETLCRLSK